MEAPLRIIRAPALQVTDRRLAEGPRRHHPVEVGAVDLRFPGGALFFGELTVVSASALANALAADGA